MYLLFSSSHSEGWSEKPKSQEKVRLVPDAGSTRKMIEICPLIHFMFSNPTRKRWKVEEVAVEFQLHVHEKRAAQCRHLLCRDSVKTSNCFPTKRSIHANAIALLPDVICVIGTQSTHKRYYSCCSIDEITYVRLLGFLTSLPHFCCAIDPVLTNCHRDHPGCSYFGFAILPQLWNSLLKKL